MSEVYFLGDLHAGHKNIANFRKDFASEEDHYSFMKEEYHKVVTKRDRVFFMGDTAFTKERLADIASWIGHKTAILGNHDMEKECSIMDYVNAFDDVQGFMKYKEFWLSHAPIHPNELRGKVNIHGHVHNATIDDLRYFNTSLENIGYKPISLQQIRRIVYKE